MSKWDAFSAIGQALDGLNDEPPVHFFHFDARFCGAVKDGETRRVSPDANSVTCPHCLANVEMELA